MAGKKSYFETSIYADKIAEVIRAYLGKREWPKARIYEEIVKIDKDVPEYNGFVKWVSKIEKERQKRARAILADVKNVHGLTDDQLLKTALEGTFKLGNAVVKETVLEAQELLKEGKQLPKEMKKTIMEWFFKGIDQHNKAKLVRIKQNQGELLETIVDNLMTAAQYGKLREKDDIIDGEIEEEDIKSELLTETKELYAGTSDQGGA